MSDSQVCITRSIAVRAERRFGFVDLTAELDASIKASGLVDGLCIAFCRHTTCGLMINEWEDGAQEDLVKRLEVLVPEAGYFAHDDMTRRTQNVVPNERANGRSHVLQMLIGGNSQVVPVSDGKPQLGQWQRLFLLELDEPKAREIVFQAFGSALPPEPELPTLERWTLERSR
jgi:secondary thiamine-phosphate synthase enzyme